MTSHMMIAIAVGESAPTPEMMELSDRDAALLLDTLKACRGLGPGEAVQRLSAAFAGMGGITVYQHIDVPPAPPENIQFPAPGQVPQEGEPLGDPPAPESPPIDPPAMPPVTDAPDDAAP